MNSLIQPWVWHWPLCPDSWGGGFAPFSEKGKRWKQWQISSSWALKSLHCGWWPQSWNWKMIVSWQESYDKPRQGVKKQRHHFANKGPSSQSYGFSSGQVWMWELNHKESWAPKNWCFWTLVLEKTLFFSFLEKTLKESLEQEIQPVNLFFLNYLFVIFGYAGSSLLRQLFFGCGKQGLLSHCGAQASYCSCFSCCKAQVLECTDFSSCGTWAQ